MLVNEVNGVETGGTVEVGAGWGDAVYPNIKGSRLYFVVRKLIPFFCLHIYIVLFSIACMFYMILLKKI